MYNNSMCSLPISFSCTVRFDPPLAVRFVEYILCSHFVAGGIFFVNVVDPYMLCGFYKAPKVCKILHVKRKYCCNFPPQKKFNVFFSK